MCASERGGKDARLTVATFLALVFQVAAGIFAVQSRHVHISYARATAYAVAAVYNGWRTGIDPFELVGVARNESDFIETKRSRDGKDCGMTQTRVTVTRYSCRQLRRSFWLAFHEAARELSEYASSCHNHADFTRCRLNRYNSGIRYAKRGPHGAYWLRVQCFAQAARATRDTGDACRRARTRRDIARIVRRGVPRYPTVDDEAQARKVLADAALLTSRRQR
jgi:hypothetical protein